MNDIQLTRTEENKYDWTIVGDDFVTVQENKQLANKVLHAILLHKNELLQSNYDNKGCDAYKYYYLSDNEDTMNLVREEIRITCKELDGIVEAQVETDNRDGTTVTEVKIITDDGKEVIVNAT